MRIYALIQARCGSKRLPNKVIKLINGKSTIEHLHKRMTLTNFFSKIVILTSDEKKDDKIINICKKKKYRFFRGSEKNVSLRFFNFCLANEMDFFLRVNADSPLLDFNIIEKKIKFLKKFQIVTNCMVKTYPKGQSFELISKKIFVNSYKYFYKKSHFEHVTRYFYDNHKKYKILNFKLNINLNKKYNFCIDTMSDFKRIKKIFHKLKKLNLKNYNLDNLIELYDHKIR